MSREEAQQELTAPWQETDGPGAFSRREKEHYRAERQTEPCWSYSQSSS